MTVRQIISKIGRFIEIRCSFMLFNIYFISSYETAIVIRKT